MSRIFRKLLMNFNQLSMFIINFLPKTYRFLFHIHIFDISSFPTTPST